MIDSTTTIEVALRKHNIIYRNLDFSNNSFFCCNLPNGLTFDLLVGTDGSIRLWRFVGTTSVSKSGMRIECHKPDHPYAVMGFEVTDEGDICFYAKQRINLSDLNTAQYLYKIIDGYSKIITKLHTENVLM